MWYNHIPCYKNTNVTCYKKTNLHLLESHSYDPLIVRPLHILEQFIIVITNVGAYVSTMGGKWLDAVVLSILFLKINFYKYYIYIIINIFTRAWIIKSFKISTAILGSARLWMNTSSKVDPLYIANFSNISRSRSSVASGTGKSAAHKSVMNFESLKKQWKSI